jgi:hypothetical protein
MNKKFFNQLAASSVSDFNPCTAIHESLDRLRLPPLDDFNINGLRPTRRIMPARTVTEIGYQGELDALRAEMLDICQGVGLFPEQATYSFWRKMKTALKELVTTVSCIAVWAEQYGVFSPGLSTFIATMAQELTHVTNNLENKNNSYSDMKDYCAKITQLIIDLETSDPFEEEDTSNITVNSSCNCIVNNIGYDIPMEACIQMGGQCQEPASDTKPDTLQYELVKVDQSFIDDVLYWLAIAGASAAILAIIITMILTFGADSPMALTLIAAILAWMAEQGMDDTEFRQQLEGAGIPA